MSISVQLEGDTSKLAQKLKSLSELNLRAVTNSISEGLRTETVERFRTETSPDNKKWEKSNRAIIDGGKTLTDTALMRNSIRSTNDSKSIAIGTNDIRARTHQFGEPGRIIRPKNKKALRFMLGDKYITVKQVTYKAPARPFLGISEEDLINIKEQLETAISEN